MFNKYLARRKPAPSQQLQPASFGKKKFDWAKQIQFLDAMLWTILFSFAQQLHEGACEI